MQVTATTYRTDHHRFCQAYACQPFGHSIRGVCPGTGLGIATSERRVSLGHCGFSRSLGLVLAMFSRVILTSGLCFLAAAIFVSSICFDVGTSIVTGSIEHVCAGVISICCGSSQTYPDCQSTQVVPCAHHTCVRFRGVSRCCDCLGCIYGAHSRCCRCDHVLAILNGYAWSGSSASVRWTRVRL